MQNLDLENESGRSMIEMLGVLAIIGVLSVGGIAGYSKAMTKYRINKVIEQVTLISTNIRTFFAPQKAIDIYFDADFKIDDTYDQMIKKAKLVPDEMMEIVEGEPIIRSITHAFGGSVVLKGNKTEKKFVIRFHNIPEEACVDLLTQDWSNTYSKYISIEFSTFYNFEAPVAVDLAVKACDKAYADPDNTYGVSLVWAVGYTRGADDLTTEIN